MFAGNFRTRNSRNQRYCRARQPKPPVGQPEPALGGGEWGDRPRPRA
jgi:hypothetical protein